VGLYELYYWWDDGQGRRLLRVDSLRPEDAVLPVGFITIAFFWSLVPKAEKPDFLRLGSRLAYLAWKITVWLCTCCRGVPFRRDSDDDDVVDPDSLAARRAAQKRKILNRRKKARRTRHGWIASEGSGSLGGSQPG
jgi:hypothetical protein